MFFKLSVSPLICWVNCYRVIYLGNLHQNAVFYICYVLDFMSNFMFKRKEKSPASISTCAVVVVVVVDIVIVAVLQISHVMPIGSVWINIASSILANRRNYPGKSQIRNARSMAHVSRK